MPAVWNPAPSQGTNPSTVPFLSSYHPVASRYQAAQAPSLAPIYGQLKNGGVNLMVDSGQLLGGDMGYSPSALPDGASFYGGYQKDKKQFILSSDNSKNWWHDVPHEYAHYVTETQKPQLMNEITKYFKDREDMADSYADYWNDPSKYVKNYPQQAQWFKTNFLTSSVPPPVMQAKKTRVAVRMK